MNILSNFHNVSELIVKSVYCNGLKWFSHWSIKIDWSKHAFKWNCGRLFPSLCFCLDCTEAEKWRERKWRQARNSRFLLIIISFLKGQNPATTTLWLALALTPPFDLNCPSPAWCSAGQRYAPHPTSCRQYLQCSGDNQVSIVVLNVILQKNWF